MPDISSRSSPRSRLRSTPAAVRACWRSVSLPPASAKNVRVVVLRGSRPLRTSAFFTESGNLTPRSSKREAALPVEGSAPR